MCRSSKRAFNKASRNRGDLRRFRFSAIVVLSQLKDLGLKCPQDIGVVGFNDIALSKNFSPALTTIRLPSAEMGKLSAEVLIRQIKSNTVLKQQLLLPVELKVRKSTRKIR